MNKERKNYFIKYSIIFVILASVIIYFYYSQGKSLINYGGDGFRQYFRALIYIRSHYLTILNNIFVNHSFVVPQWDFAIGEGSDIIETFHYYGLGDPINIFSVLVKEEYLYLFYDFSIFLRMYLVGLMFSQFCFYKNENENAILIGSVLYSFCSFSLSSAYGHLLFINALIYLPFVILGIEKVLNNDSWKTLTVSVFLSSITSIYFFYMIVIITIIYTLVRVLYINKNIKEVFPLLIKITCYSFLGVLLSGLIFIPSFFSLISNSRLTEIKHSLLYDSSYYLDLLSNYVYSFSYFGGYTILGLFATVNLFSNNKNRCLKILLIIGLVMCCIPFFGKLFNAMTYVTDRWLFAMDFLICYIIVRTYEDLINDKKIVKYILILVPYLSFCSLYKVNDKKIFILLMLIGVMALFIIKRINNDKYKSYILTTISVFSLVLCIFFIFSPQYWNYSGRGTDISIINNMKNEEHSVFDNLDSEEFYRYSGNSLTTNQGCLGKKSSTPYYWSVSNSNVIDFRKEFGLSDRNNHHYDNYDDSYILNTLSSVKYFVNDGKSVLPYGYREYSNINGYDIYINENSMPLIYGYDSYIKEDDFRKFDIIQKQEAITQSIVLIEDENDVGTTNITFDSEKVDFTLITDGIKTNGDTISSLNDDAYIKLVVNSQKEGEYYLLVNGLTSNESFDLPIETSKINDKGIIYKDETNAGYSNRHDFCINLGYYKNFDDEIIIHTPRILDFTIKDINLVCLPLTEIVDNIEKLNCVNIKSSNIDVNSMEANISLSQAKYLCFSIPYHNGWTLKVDGKKEELRKCNLMYTGSYIDEGEHLIQLEYKTPFLKEGTFVSMFGLLLFLSISIKDRKHKIQEIKRKQKHIL